MTRIPAALAISILAASCGGRQPPRAASPARAAAAVPASAPAPAARPFENPGGMWMPRQLRRQAARLKRAGLRLDPAALTDPTKPPLAAVLDFDDICTASFVSPDGLIITNHHCARGAVQYNSTAKRNLLKSGFLATTRAGEKPGGPALRVYVTRNMTDVTGKIRAGLAGITAPLARERHIESKNKQLIAACERGRPQVRCQVHAFFQGAEYYLIEALRLRDIRLVYAPAEGIGFFGGNKDNWMWPRYDGDYAFFRAYVGPDGKPADYSPKNVPYHPAHYLTISRKPLRAGDFVLVAGYPGRTNRNKTAAEMEHYARWYYPYKIAEYKEYNAALTKLAKRDPAAGVKAQVFIFDRDNAIKADQGILDGLVKGGVIAKKRAEERALTAWIQADPARRRNFGGAIAQMAAIDAAHWKTQPRDLAFYQLTLSDMFETAMDIVRMAVARPKPDAARDPRFQKRNWNHLEAEMTALSKTYSRAMDRTVLKVALVRAARDSSANGHWLALAFGKSARFDAASVDERLGRMYARTRLESDKVRLQLFRTATIAELRRSRDPFIEMALALLSTEKQVEDDSKRFEGARSAVAPVYISALRAFRHGDLAPDANSTLRITYGTIRGYRKKPGAALEKPFTVLSGLVARNTGKPPYQAPERELAAISARRFGPYVNPHLGQVPVDFLSDVDTTGGNSGSPTLDADGHLVGLLFDGNIESMASDWVYLPKVTRSIHVDINYVLWLMDAVDHADNLLRELGVTPTFSTPAAAAAASAR